MLSTKSSKAKARRNASESEFSIYFTATCALLISFAFFSSISFLVFLFEAISLNFVRLCDCVSEAVYGCVYETTRIDSFYYIHMYVPSLFVCLLLRVSSITFFSTVGMKMNEWSNNKKKTILKAVRKKKYKKITWSLMRFREVWA